MTQTTVREILSGPADWDGRAVSLNGWVRTVRGSKTFGFIELHDGSCFRPLQVVLEAETLENFSEAVKLHAGGRA